MATIQYTKEQQRAIDTLDKNILVSAAAGSGKTAILIQRIINIVLQGKADVDEMLIVTFTNAAAAEMRAKLSREIKKRMQEEGSDKKKLSEQLDKLYRAYISTFDSFAIRVIREFFYDIDIEPDFKTCDEVMGTMLKNQAVDELFEEAFIDDNLIEGGSFREFLRLYSSDRSENRIKEEIVSAYDKLRSMPEYFSWAHDKAKNLDIDEESFKGSKVESFIRDSFNEMLDEVYDDICIVRRLYYDANLADMYERGLAGEKDLIEDLRNSEISDELISRLIEFKFPSLPKAKKDEKAAYEDIKGYVKELRERYKKRLSGWVPRYFAPDLKTRIMEMQASYKYTEYFINLLEAFEVRYGALKKEQGMMDFADMEHTASRILNNKEIADTLRNRFKYIFVDEYQDTNNIQEDLISKISRDDNVFKVGDVKQSIYRFRQAEPSIFKKLYESYKNGEVEHSEAIDLNKNFRCNRATVNYINKVFEDAMEGYDDDAALHVGVDENTCPPDYDFTPEVHLLTIPQKKGAEEEIEVDETLRDLSNDEAEAEHVAKYINGLIGTEFMDTAAKTVRKVEARDVTILIRGGMKVRGGIYTKALRNYDIQSHASEEDEYFDTIEVRVAISLLMTIDNFKRDIPLIATLHSEIFGFTTDELGTIRAEHKEHLKNAEATNRRGVPYWSAVKWYVDEGSNNGIRDMLADAIAKLEEWRELSLLMPLSDFIWKLLTDSNYYMFAGAMYGGGRKQANLRALADKASEFSENRIASLGDYIAYLEVLRKKKVKTGQASLVSKDDNVVQITTIHKSKGLEYPFVIIAGMGVKHNSENNSKGFKFDTSIGVGLPYVSPDKKYWRSTLAQRAILEKINRDEAEEELRVLYVAMTRARNKLIMVGSLKEGDESKIKSGLYTTDNYFKVLGRNVAVPGLNHVVRGELKKSGMWDVQSRAKDVIEACSKPVPKSEAEEYNKVYDEISRRLNYRYPDEKQKFKAKYSVSEIRKEVLAEIEMSENGTADEEVVSIVRRSNAQKRRASSADIGIAYHRIMEFMDFGKALNQDANGETAINDLYISECAETLAERGAIDEEAYKEVNLERVHKFFESDLGRRAARASALGTLKKEKPFTIVHERNGQSVLVQGVIDCCFEEDGEMVLIDYKSSFVRKGFGYARDIAKIKRDYMPQIEIYSEALKQGTGKPLKEAYLYLFLSDEAIRMEEDDSESARQVLGRLCKKIGLSDLEGYDLSADASESRKLIDSLNANIASVIIGPDSNPYDELGPAPDDCIWCELANKVKTGFPKGFKKAEDVELARMVHQLRYVISAQQAEYVRAKFPAKTDEDSLAKYFSTIKGNWSSEESDRLHNKYAIESKALLGGRLPNIKLVCGHFHSEFILDSQGNFLYILNPKATINDVVNGSSFNYADGNDLWLDGEENPLSMHGFLDVHISKFDPRFRRNIVKEFTSLSLIEYRIKGLRAASSLRKNTFCRKVK